MNNRTARLLRQARSMNHARGTALGLEWHAASSHRARGRVNARLRAIAAQRRLVHALRMQALLDENAGS